MGSGRVADTLYSVWRNSDDKLLILDGTMEQCCKKMGIKRNTFYRLVNNDNKYGSLYTIRKISRKKALSDSQS